MVNFKASAIEYPLLRDFHAAMPKSPDIAVSQNQAINTRKGRLSNIGITGGKRTFFVINTKTQLALPHEIQAELFYQSDALSVWLPEGYNMSNSLIFDDCIQRIETIVLPRIENLWGKSADIDGDGRIALLFSHTLNDEQVAIGFFNPSDFFKRNEDTHSDAYNYASNEMDIIYVAIPDTEPNSSYSLQNVIATIAHELTHACTFTSKTYNRILNGDSNAKREDLFLDEGLSHLTENLCGFGVSGGNVRFLKRFLEDTSMYSLCGPNRIGQNDSAGMRGAMTLFLSWLFWKSGGMSWDASNQILLNDKGGILFLRKLANSAKTGLDNIENSFGKPVYLLFNEMLDEINRYRMTGRSFNYITDPITNEAVDFFVNMGALHYSDNAEPVIIGFPVSGSAYGANTLLPWSFIFFDPFTNNNDMLLTIKATKNNGGVFFACSN
ncbi:MAG: hypothetical protein LBU85_00785 [Treponema sp.]|nr:hypothetical protein [Treponema sp.]